MHSRLPAWIAGWGLWTLPRHILVYALATHAVAVAATVATASAEPLTALDWSRFAFLALCATLQAAMSRGIDRARAAASPHTPTIDTKTVWSFAAVLVLPVIQACALVVLTNVLAWLCAWRGRKPLYRAAFSTSAVVIATQVAAAILVAGHLPHPGLPTTVGGLAVVAAAAALRYLVNVALVAVAIMLSTPNARAHQVLHNMDDNILELGALGLGVVTAGLVVYNPLLLVGVVAGLFAMHRGVLLPQLRRAASTDIKTGLYTAARWHQIAQHAYERAVSTGPGIAVFMLDLDHFKRVNDTYGHMAGDQVLHAVASAIDSEISGACTAGRWGGEEFVVLAPHANPTELQALAERLRRRVHALVVDVTMTTGHTLVKDLTVSVGVAVSPAPGIGTIDDLMLAADSALYTAKDNGRDQVRFSSGVADRAIPPAPDPDHDSR